MLKKQQPMGNRWLSCHPKGPDQRASKGSNSKHSRERERAKKKKKKRKEKEGKESKPERKKTRKIWRRMLTVAILLETISKHVSHLSLSLFLFLFLLLFSFPLHFVPYTMEIMNSIFIVFSTAFTKVPARRHDNLPNRRYYSVWSPVSTAVIQRSCWNVQV